MSFTMHVELSFILTFQNFFFFSVQALYQESHPQYLNYIYLIAPVSVVILNPIGFLLLEIQKKREGDKVEVSKSINESGSKSGTCALILHVIKGVITNPIVFMTIIGIAGNFILRRNLPLVISEILDVLGIIIIFVLFRIKTCD